LITPLFYLKSASRQGIGTHHADPVTSLGCCFIFIPRDYLIAVFAIIAPLLPYVGNNWSWYIDNH
jgi:hypothetical protein